MERGFAETVRSGVGMFDSGGTGERGTGWRSRRGGKRLQEDVSENMGVESGAEEIGRDGEDGVKRLEIGGCELVGEGGEDGGGACVGDARCI